MAFLIVVALIGWLAWNAALWMILLTGAALDAAWRSVRRWR